MNFHQRALQMIELGYGFKYLGSSLGLICYRLPNGEVQCASETSIAYFMEHGKKMERGG